MYRVINFGLILTAAALLCRTAPVLADGPTVPYKDHLSGQVTDLGGGYPTFTQSYSAQGEATHLGRCQVSGSQTLLFVAGHPLEVGAHGEILHGLIQYTAADGSVLMGQYSGTFKRTSPYFVVLTVDIEFVGVTGRLVGVHGTTTATIIASGPFVGNSFSWTSDGEWTFPD
jgi:hypothetical protein